MTTEPTCTCQPNWYGQVCDISNTNAELLIKNIDQDIKNLGNSTDLSEVMIQNLVTYQNIIASNSSMITPELAEQINNIAQNQINMIIEGKIQPNENILNVLDFSLELTL